MDVKCSKLFSSSLPTYQPMILPNHQFYNCFFLVVTNRRNLKKQQQHPPPNIIQVKMKNYSTTPPAATGLPAKNPSLPLCSLCSFHNSFQFNFRFFVFFIIIFVDNLLLLLYSLIIYYETIYSSQQKQ